MLSTGRQEQVLDITLVAMVKGLDGKEVIKTARTKCPGMERSCCHQWCHQ